MLYTTSIENKSRILKESVIASKWKYFKISPDPLSFPHHYTSILRLHYNQPTSTRNTMANYADNSHWCARLGGSYRCIQPLYIQWKNLHPCNACSRKPYRTSRYNIYFEVV